MIWNPEWLTFGLAPFWRRIADRLRLAAFWSRYSRWRLYWHGLSQAEQAEKRRRCEAVTAASREADAVVDAALEDGRQ
ncbi:MAG TPA: hypothetical protein VL418_13490 [Devosiaceae bacterium]|jgi:hypothetical protein|nr:hypothetical protein [Devosiaceae bacterium]